jgi:nucleotide-binding universal stress UspA family protein
MTATTDFMETRLHLLVPTDFRAAARKARQFALQLAFRGNAQLTLLHVTPAPSDWQSTGGLDALELLHGVLRLPADQPHHAPTLAPRGGQARRIALHRLRSEVHPEWRDAVRVHTAWRQGDVVREILDFARQERIDAILLGRQRHSWSWRWRLPLADRVARAAPCEVIVVSPPPQPAMQSAGQSPDESRLLPRLLELAKGLPMPGWPK